MKDTGFHDFILHDLLRDVPGVTSRAMFGGWCLYKERVVFGIVAESTLYLKSSASSSPVNDLLSAEPFTYEHKEKEVQMKDYRRVPEEWLEGGGRVREFVRNVS